jgi:hypothetical protein
MKFRWIATGAAALALMAGLVAQDGRPAGCWGPSTALSATTRQGASA